MRVILAILDQLIKAEVDGKICSEKHFTHGKAGGHGTRPPRHSSSK